MFPQDIVFRGQFDYVTDESGSTKGDVGACAVLEVAEVTKERLERYILHLCWGTGGSHCEKPEG